MYQSFRLGHEVGHLIEAYHIVLARRLAELFQHDGHILEDTGCERNDFAIIFAFLPKACNVLHGELVKFLDACHRSGVFHQFLLLGLDGIQTPIVLILYEFLRGCIGHDGSCGFPVYHHTPASLNIQRGKEHRHNEY